MAANEVRKNSLKVTFTVYLSTLFTMTAAALLKTDEKEDRPLRCNNPTGYITVALSEEAS